MGLFGKYVIYVVLEDGEEGYVMWQHGDTELYLSDDADCANRFLTEGECERFYWNKIHNLRRAGAKIIKSDIMRR